MDHHNVTGVMYVLDIQKTNILAEQMPKGGRRGSDGDAGVGVDQLPPEQMVALHDVVGRDAQVCKDPVGLSAEGQSLQKHDEALVGELLQTDTFPLCQGVVLMDSQLEDVPKQQGGFKYLPINARGGDRQIDLTPVEQRSDLLVFCDPLIPLVVGVLVHEGVHPLKKLRGGDRQGNGVVPLIGNILELPL